MLLEFFIGRGFNAVQYLYRLLTSRDGISALMRGDLLNHPAPPLSCRLQKLRRLLSQWRTVQHLVLHSSPEDLDAGANGRQEASERWQNEEEVRIWGRLFKDFQERILRFVIGTARRHDDDFMLTHKRRP